MSLIYFGAGFIVGSVTTALLGVFLIKHKMKTQLGMMEEQMDLLMDSAEKIGEGDFDMPDNMGDVQDVEPKDSQ
ncbi:hypothetical protein [Candidatus Nanohalococcus occultus]|uniref:Uncharacterized protein n=1 Tax=Candidatus Nanohalococcus occultus TaxID=2978047 RepID=A0ABY8CJV5_9ARCH|nr:hypothetical protein SVXNc_0600 [Candidatus Nanohaloarchaeota archaeon SVXNc]